MAVSIRSLERADCAAWDEFVLSHPHGSPFHMIAWKEAIESTYGYAGQHLMAWDGDRLAGVLPVFLVSNVVMKKALISSPFAVYGGILADSEEVRRALAGRVAELGRELRVQYVELRNGYEWQRAGFSPIDRYVTYTLPTFSDPETLMEHLPKKCRNMVRKALKSPFSSRRETESARVFEKVHSATMRRLGTPCFPPRLFDALLSKFRGRIDIREVLLGDRVAAVSMNFFFRDQMHTYYAASDPQYLAAAPNNFLYYDHILWAGQNGYPVFDFGRSKIDTGTGEFKKGWGATPRPLPYEILLVERKDLPNFSPKNPKFELAINLWKRLPLPVTRVLGPPLNRLFP